MRPVSTPHVRLPAIVALTALGLALLPHPAAAAKEPKKRVAVTNFTDESHFHSYEWGDIGGGMTEKLNAALIDTGKFVVLERVNLAAVLQEQNLDALAPVNPVQAARLTTAQALIMGVITNVETDGGEESQTGFKKLMVNLQRQGVTVKVNIRIVDTVTGQVIQSKTVEGTAKKRKIGLGSAFKKFHFHGKKEIKTPIGDAIDDAVQQAVDEIVAGLERIPWQGAIARVSGRQIFINAGGQENVEPGLRLRVFEKGKELIDTETNVDLGSLDEEIGLIEVERVEPKFSVARVVQGRGFAPGNIVRPEGGV